MEEIIKQILTNQQVIMTVLSENCDESCKKMINYENGKTTELFARNVFDKTFYNSLYGNSMKDYIKKEDLEKFIIQNKQDIQFYNENEESEYMKQFYSGIRYALNIIRVKFI